jgi:hypothetical protein
MQHEVGLYLCTEHKLNICYTNLYCIKLNLGGRGFTGPTFPCIETLGTKYIRTPPPPLP